MIFEEATNEGYGEISQSWAYTHPSRLRSQTLTRPVTGSVCEREREGGRSKHVNHSTKMTLAVADVE
jgi:hypothetical protein